MCTGEACHARSHNSDLFSTWVQYCSGDDVGRIARKSLHTRLLVILNQRLIILYHIVPLVPSPDLLR